MNILKEKFFSIIYFNDEGLEKVSELTAIELEELEFEQDSGNHFVGQAENGKYFLFCETDQPEDEITFSEFQSLLL